MMGWGVSLKLLKNKFHFIELVIRYVEAGEAPQL